MIPTLPHRQPRRRLARLRPQRVTPGRVFAWVLLILAIVLTVFPFYWMVRTALTPAGDMVSDALRPWPRHPTLVNFRRILGLTTLEESQAAGGSGASINFARYTVNSLVYSGTIAVVQTLACAAAAYAFARLRFPGRQTLFTVVVMGLMVPGIFTLIPNFTLIKDAGLTNTMLGMVAPSLLMTPFAIFFLRQFFLSLPRDVEEAAMLDGVSALGIFWRICLPMSRGPLVTTALTTVVWTWKDFLWPLLVGREDSVRVLTVALGVFQQQSPNRSPDWTGLMAGSTLSVLPVLIILIVLGRQLVQSLNFSGIK